MLWFFNRRSYSVQLFYWRNSHADFRKIILTLINWFYTSYNSQLLGVWFVLPTLKLRVSKSLTTILIFARYESILPTEQRLQGILYSLLCDTTLFQRSITVYLRRLSKSELLIPTFNNWSAYNIIPDPFNQAFYTLCKQWTLHLFKSVRSFYYAINNNRASSCNTIVEP